jgi:integrase
VASFIRIDGPKGVRWKALVRRKRGGLLVYSAARTFSRRALAVTWAAKLEGDLEDPAKMERAGTGPTVGDLIRRYIREIDEIRPLGRTHRAVLEFLLDWPIAGKRARTLRPGDVVEHCEARAKKGTGPATVMQDVVLLRGPLGIARVKWHLAGVSTLAIDDAMPLLVKLGLVARSKHRDRRLEGDEGARLLAYFKVQDEDSVIPMADIMDFALWTCRREGEICRVTWTDLDRKNRTLTVRAVKHPRQRDRDLTFPLLGDALKIIDRQPVTDERIFPYKRESVGSRFTRAKKVLKIVDLRFHDLKREAVSRLFEEGYTIEEVAQVAGNKDLNILWGIYTKMRPEKFKRR